MSDDSGDQNRPGATPAPYRGSAPRQPVSPASGADLRPGGPPAVATADELEVTLPPGGGSEGLRLDRLEVTPAPKAPSGYAGSDPVGRSTLLVVGLDYAADPARPGGHTTRLARDLAGVAQRVFVFTGVNDDPESFPSSLEPKIDRHNRRSYGQDGRVHVVRHRHPRPGGPTPGGRLRAHLGFARAVLGTPVRHVPDLVIGVTPGPGAAIAADRLSRRYGTPLVMVVEDRPEQPHRGPLSALLAWRESEALRHANRVVVADDDARRHVLARGVEADRIDQLSGAWPVPEPRGPVEAGERLDEPARAPGLGKVAARRQLGWPTEGFVAVYAGNIGFTQDVATVLRAAQALAPTVPEIRFAVVGDGSRRALMEQAAGELPAVRFLDPVTAADYPALIAAADALLVTELPGKPDRTLAGRLRTYLVSGRPVIAAVNPDGVNGRLVRASEDPVSAVPPGDAQAMAQALTRLHEQQPTAGTTTPAPQTTTQPETRPTAPRPAPAAADPGAESQRLHEIARALLVRRTVRNSL